MNAQRYSTAYRTVLVGTTYISMFIVHGNNNYEKVVSWLCIGYEGMLPWSFETNKGRYRALSVGIHN